jgi:hypothetical protein
LSAQIEDVEVDRERQHKPQKSWWRNIYDRISQGGPDPEHEPLTRAPSRRKLWSRSIYHTTSCHHHSRDHPSKHHSRNVDCLSLLHHDQEYEDPPPASVIKTYRGSQRRQESGDGKGHSHMRSDTDVLAPLDVFDQHHSRSQHQHLRVVQPHGPKSAQGLILPATPISCHDSLLARVFTNGGMSMTLLSDHDDERSTLH